MHKQNLTVKKLGFPWITQDPFLFCVHHLDFYPEGNKELGPNKSLHGRNIGNDFIVKDGWRMYHGDKVPGFPVHPHRGFETITFVLRGMVDHADSNGSAGRYGKGDVQWMTAGSGLQHSEMFPLLNEEKENTLELFQIWLNLPAKHKFAKPFYKMLWSEEIPVYSFTDNLGKTTKIDVVAGKIENVVAPSPAPDSWAFNPENEVAVWHIIMEENATWEIPSTTNKINRSIYFFEGDQINVNKENLLPGFVAELNSSEKTLLKNGNKKSRCLILQGKPINEPVIQYGPFVMNSEDEIRQAFDDYRKTQFGGWPWSRSDQVHDKLKGRFASFDDGTIIQK